MTYGSVLLRTLSSVFYGLEFCCSGIILGIYSYFLSVLADRNEPIAHTWKAVEGISGITVLYTLAAIVSTWLLRHKVLAIINTVLNLAFCAAFLALAVLTRDGAHSCTGYVESPLGRGRANQRNGFGRNGFGTGSGENVTYAGTFGFSCRLNSAAFAVAVIGAVFFLISALLQLWIARSSAKEDQDLAPYQPNTADREKPKFWQRKAKTAELAEQKV